MADLDLMAMLCSRLCHDLVSPIGAITNGAEILADEIDEEMRGEAIRLMSQSALEASKRLQFYRMAFGVAGGATQTIGLSQGHKVATAFYSGGAIELNWDEPRIEVNKSVLKILLNLILIAGETLIRGGSLEVRVNEDRDQLNLAVTATGSRVKINENVNAALSHSSHPVTLDTRAVPASLVSTLVAQLDGDLDVQIFGDTRVVLSARVPRR